MSLANIVIEELGSGRWVGHVEAGIGGSFRRVHLEAPSGAEMLKEVERVYLEQMGATPPPTSAPEVVDIPHVSAVADVFTCTMGNWTGEPDTYAYQWKRDGADIGADAATYAAGAADVGRLISCVVTATNAAGSTTAPPSNEVIFAPPSGFSRSYSRAKR